MIFRGGILTHANKGLSAQYHEFLNQLTEGQKVEVFFDAQVKTGTNAQRAKIYKCIRELAKETGITFEEMKTEIKKRAGFQYKLSDGNVYCKSFADCSIDELASVIETIISIGDLVGINFR